MPKIGFTVMPQFTPTTFEDWYKPMEAYINTYNDFQEGYQKLLDDTAQWEKLAKQEGSEEAYVTYKAYRDQLEKAANDLATKGWSRERDIPSAMKLRTQYMQDITPINEAYNRLQKLADEQRQKNADGDLIYDIDYSDFGVDALVKDPNKTYNAISKKTLEDTGYKLGNALSKNANSILKADPNYGAQYLQALQQGYTHSDALTAVEDPTAANEINELINAAMQGIGSNFNTFSEDKKNQVRSQIVTGILEGLSSDTKYLQNLGYDGANYTSRSGSGSGSNSDITLWSNGVYAYKTNDTEKKNPIRVAVVRGNDGQYHYNYPKNTKEEDFQFDKDGNLIVETDESGKPKSVPWYVYKSGSEKYLTADPVTKERLNLGEDNPAALNESSYDYNYADGSRTSKTSGRLAENPVTIGYEKNKGIVQNIDLDAKVGVFTSTTYRNKYNTKTYSMTWDQLTNASNVEPGSLNDVAINPKLSDNEKALFEDFKNNLSTIKSQLKAELGSNVNYGDYVFRVIAMPTRIVVEAVPRSGNVTTNTNKSSEAIETMDENAH